jgi:hypothetical protein
MMAATHDTMNSPGDFRGFMKCTAIFIDDIFQKIGRLSREAD